jgi:hypothetical protein
LYTLTGEANKDLKMAAAMKAAAICLKYAILLHLSNGETSYEGLTGGGKKSLLSSEKSYIIGL